MREWIQDGVSDDAVNVYLVRFTRDGSHHGWQRADASGVLDILAGQAFASFIDEEADDISVSILTEMGALPVRVETERCPGIGMVSVELWYRDPFKRGKAAQVKADRGFYKIPGA